MTNLEARCASGVGRVVPLGENVPTDAELLARWSSGTDPHALGLLIRRHGGMVFGVCRRTLGNTPDADDAFQATFLVLVRKAHTLARPEQVAGWLHGVALRIARKARADRSRRHQREVISVDPVAPAPPENTQDLRQILDEELDRLPEKYRLPIVLCELEGHTLEEAARLLGWPKGTVAGRLSRGRELLRKRLSRRGIGLPLFLGLPIPGLDLAGTIPPEPLVAATLSTASGGASVTSHVAALATAALRVKGRYLTLLLLLFLLMGTTVVAAGVIRDARGSGSGPQVIPSPSSQPTGTPSTSGSHCHPRS
jgi:RNA polymerase sigma factor (sigma-70 family)